MSKFKVGDKVKVNAWKSLEGGEYTIVAIVDGWLGDAYKIDAPKCESYMFDDYELELVS